jgi:probable phosphoglycerate mutase
MGHDDSPLTGAGREQVRAISDRLASARFRALYASDLPRAVSTAEAIASATGHSIRFDRRLRERHAGLLQGLVDGEARSRHPEVFRELDAPSPDYAVPGGESARDLRRRVASFVEEILEEHARETVVVVAHGGIARALLWHLLDIPYRASRWARCDNTSVSAFVRKRGMWVLERWNDVAHLGDNLSP